MNFAILKGYEKYKPARIVYILTSILTHNFEYKINIFSLNTLIVKWMLKKIYKPLITYNLD